MKNELMIHERNDELVIGSMMIATKMGVDHRTIKRIIEKQKIPIFQISAVAQSGNGEDIKKRKKDGKFDLEELLLTEENAIIVCAYIRKNSPEVSSFIKKLSKEFMAQRKLLGKIYNQRFNAEWEENRRLGKIERHTETDVIKEFIEYAKSQGSKNSDKYYLAITKMENSALFNLELIKFEYRNLREIVSSMGLDSLRMADHIVAKALKEGIEKRMYYKDIFQIAKSRIESYSDLIGRMQVDTSPVKAMK